MFPFLSSLFTSFSSALPLNGCGGPGLTAKRPGVNDLGLSLGALALLLVATGCGSEGATPPAARNLVLVVIDTLRQDRVGVYGYPRPLTPTLDRLAREGAFADGLAPSSWTRPSVATLFSGLHPLRHQVAIKTDRFPDSVSTLPERLRVAGFSTLGISTNGHVAAAWGFDRGFDELLATWRLGLGRDTPAAAVNGAVADRLGRLRPPFFLYVHYLDPHQPYAPPAGWDGAPLPANLRALSPLSEGPELPRGGPFTAARLREAADLYDGEVRAVDAALGDLLLRLAERGLDRDTLTVVLSDHGEEFGEHGGVGHGRTLHDEVVRVPLVFRAPGVVPEQGKIGLFPLESVLPTLLDLLGVAPEEAAERDFDGPSFADALRCRGVEPEPGPRLLQLEGNPEAGLALGDGGCKLLLHTTPYRKQLFHLETDRAERLERSADEEGRKSFGRLASQLAERYESLLRSAHPRRSTTADEELSQQLAALGYGGANQSQFTQRAFRRRLLPADPRPGGPRGWEDLAGFRSCSGTNEDPAGQLLEGWWGLSPGESGQWTMPTASLAIALPKTDDLPLRLELEGVSWRPRRCRMTVSTADGEERAVDVDPGPFHFSMSVTKRVTGPFALVRIVTEPSFQPQAEGLPDTRVLGIFVTRYCLTAEAHPPAPPAF